VAGGRAHEDAQRITRDRAVDFVVVCDDEIEQIYVDAFRAR
jgi:hypothetical protein